MHVLMGAIRLSVDSRQTTLRAGQVGALAPSVRHDLEALEPSSLLLTISWPESERLKPMPHLGYGS